MSVVAKHIPVSVPESSHLNLQWVVENLPEGVVVLDQSGEISVTNRVARRLLLRLADGERQDVLKTLGIHRLLENISPGSREVQAVFTVEGPPRLVLRMDMVRRDPLDIPGWMILIKDITFEQNTLRDERKRMRELNVMFRFSRKLLTARNRTAILEITARHLVDALEVTFCRIITPGDGGFSCEAAASIRRLAGDLWGNEEASPCHRYYRQVLEEHKSRFIRASDPTLSNAEREALLAGQVSSLLMVPMLDGDKTIGVVTLGEARNESRQPINQETRDLLDAMLNLAAAALRRVSLHHDLHESHVQTVLALARAMDARDAYTGDHGLSLARWAQRIALKLELDEAETETIRWGALLHDIGKIGVPDDILHKLSPLSLPEWQVMRRHPEIGAEIVASCKKLADSAPLIRGHHERWDGGGYPDGLAGQQIPLGARIIAVADAYCAMTDSRIYRAAMSRTDAVAELRRGAGQQFDPRLVEVFLELEARLAEVGEV